MQFIQVACDVIKESVLDVWRAVREAALSETSSHSSNSSNVEQVTAGRPQLPVWLE